jgi:hypothetical protein
VASESLAIPDRQGGLSIPTYRAVAALHGSAASKKELYGWSSGPPLLYKQCIYQAGVSTEDRPYRLFLLSFDSFGRVVFFQGRPTRDSSALPSCIMSGQMVTCLEL